MKKIFLLLLLSITSSLFAQQDLMDQYRGSKTKAHDLIHTKLKVDFDFDKQQMNGEIWITAKPHFYATQEFVLDAKYMLIHEVKMMNRTLAYRYDDTKLTIQLGNAYTRSEEFEIYIKYTARPEKVKSKGSAVITSAKGLYFIDPHGTDPNRPTEIWTQGATESSSCWFPTIDSPNQKTTQEIYITVPNKYRTLSNGALVSQVESGTETRTDYWVMEKPHAPYLFFMGIGEYSVIKDSWNGINVDYYVEKKYENEAQAIFGNTPEMIQFFSDKFGVPYPWEKYSQVVGYDFVSGAMENTTATIHSEPAYQKAGELIDENTWEDVISHELVHQWFGDLVTTESWSNITVNESFATYGEYLWREYKYGKMHADAHLFEDKTQYIMGGHQEKNLVRFHYEDRDDVFDGVSYQKGANILHMLRNHIGDDAFFEGLKHYLIKHKYATAEAHQLRIALEEISGRDLNPFFNQWYYKNGHPDLEISYSYNKNELTVNIEQKGKTFKVPLLIEIYESGKVTDYTVNLYKNNHVFTFKTTSKPDLVNVNADHILLCTLNDKSKSLEEYIFQYNNAPHYIDKKEAIEKMAENQENKQAKATLLKALKDPYYQFRILALQRINFNNKKTLAILENLALNDSKTLVQAAAVNVFRKLDKIDSYTSIFEQGIQSPSYAVKVNSLLGLYKINKVQALQAIKTLNKEDSDYLAPQLAIIYVESNDESQMSNIAKGLFQSVFKNNPTEEDQQNFMKTFAWIASSNNEEAYSFFVTDAVSKGKRYKKYGVDQLSIGLLSQMIQMQKATSNTNKDVLLAIVKNGLAELVE